MSSNDVDIGDECRDEGHAYMYPRYVRKVPATKYEKKFFRIKRWTICILKMKWV